METNNTITFEYTNTCTCSYYDEETDESRESEHCFGDCYELMLEDFQNIISHLIENNETMWWKVTNLGLWDGNHSGYFYGDTIGKIIDGMTVNSAWIMTGTVFDDRVEYSLSHHDSMGSSTTLTMVSEDEREELGLY